MRIPTPSHVTPVTDFDADRPRLVRYAASILRDAQRAEDATQDVLCRAIESPEAVPTDEKPRRAWLFACVRNRCIDLLRKENRMKLVADLDHGTTPAATADPLETAGVADDARAALAALDDLPPPQRDCLRLRFSGGLSYKQISDSTGKSVSHVGVLIHEGLKTLRTRLSTQ